MKTTVISFGIVFGALQPSHLIMNSLHFGGSRATHIKHDNLCAAHVGALLSLLETVLLQPNALNSNEARGIHRAEVIQRVH